MKFRLKFSIFLSVYEDYLFTIFFYMALRKCQSILISPAVINQSKIRLNENTAIVSDKWNRM